MINEPGFVGKMALMLIGGMMCIVGSSTAFGPAVGVAACGAMLFLAGLFDA